MAIIKMDNVTMKYPTGTVALKDVNVEIEKGEFVFVVGSTGSGKTTFIELLLRELVPTKGRIEVYENVAFAQRVIEVPGRYIKRRVPAVLSLVGLADKYKSYPRQLSGGEQQRVALARALVNKPDIILADEPTGNLDPKHSWDVMNLLDEINSKGTTVVVVTHNKEIVNVMKKRVITLKKGVVVSDVQKGGYIDED